MGHVPGLPPGPDSGPGGRTPTAQELEELRLAAVRIALGEGVSYQDAQDVAQNTMIALWSRAESIDWQRGYLRAVARREAWRLNQRRDQPLAPDQLAFLADLGPGAARQIDDCLVEDDQVRGWISRLPPEQAEIINLMMHGFPLAEIAGRLQIPRAVVRSRFVTAREKLRTAFVAQMTADRQEEQRPAARRARPPAQPPAAAPPAREETDLAGLPPRQQEVLRLTRRGYKPAQIARVLAISPNTVRVNLFHARKRIRQATTAA